MEVWVVHRRAGQGLVRRDRLAHRRRPYRWLRYIQRLDPERDHQTIYRISVAFEFPWDYRRALELALFRTYCVPTISALLDATGEFADRAQQRYDDTTLLMAELIENGYDSPRGRAALRVVNRMHGRYAIGNDDMRYVLSTFVYEPIDWPDRYGWRPLSEHERLAAFHFYRAVGARMGIRDVPDDVGAFRDFKRQYEQNTFRYTEENNRIGRYSVELFRSWYPRPVRPLVGTAVRGFLDPLVLDSFGFPPAPGWFVRAERVGLRERARLVRMFPPRRRSSFAAYPRNRGYPGYPEGYQPTDLGAPPPPADLDPKWLRR